MRLSPVGSAVEEVLGGYLKFGDWMSEMWAGG